MARSAARRARDRAAVRYSLIERTYPSDPPPPMTRMLRGGRGGQVRLKLYLSMLWLAKQNNASLPYPARAWAELLGLRDPAAAGARRINEAQAWLERNRFVTIEARSGAPNLVTLKEESGSGADYELPGAAWSRLKGNDDAQRAHRYVQVPANFWTQGWVAVLSGPAVAMFLALLRELGPHGADTELWFSPRAATERFALSEDARSKGLRELVDAQLVEVTRRSLNPQDFDFQRVRNVYRLRPEALADTPSVPLSTSRSHTLVDPLEP